MTNQYDRYGYLTEVTDSNDSNIWKALGTNARGQLTGTQSGNTITDFAFDSRGFPTTIVTPGITNWSYIFNDQGNLASRKDGIINYRDSLTYDSMNRLTDWKVYLNNSLQQSDSLAYNANTGNIQNKSDLGGFTMNYGASGKPHALTSISGLPEGFPTDNLSITCTDFKKVKTLTEGMKNYTLFYGVDEQRIKSVYKVNNVIQKTRYYMGNYEEEIVDGNTGKIHYLSGGNGLAAIYVQNNGNDTLYYAHTDYQGSLTAISLSDGTVKERYAYDPWGNRRNPDNWTQSDTRTAFLFNRGYTMHEHLAEFKVINMNGRGYDPVTAMFFSPDPYVQAPGDWLNYNRYAYCLNNPLKYTDPTGEIVWFIPVIIGIVAGTINVAANWDNIDGFWQGVAAFGVGAGAGVAACFTGGQSFWVVAGVAAGGSALTAGTNSVIAQTGKNFEGFNQVDWGEVGISSAIGGVAGFAGGSAGYWAANASFTVNNISSPILRSAVVSPIAAGAGHVAGGTTANLIAGQNLGDAFANSFQGIGQSMAIGGAIGVGTTTAVSLASGVNPINGNKLGTTKSNIQFGNNSNQEYHTFRHTDELGLNRIDVESAVRNNLQFNSDLIQTGKPFNQVIVVNGQPIQYTAYRLPNGTINAGRIHGINIK